MLCIPRHVRFRQSAKSVSDLRPPGLQLRNSGKAHGVVAVTLHSESPIGVTPLPPESLLDENRYKESLAGKIFSRHNLAKFNSGLPLGPIAASSQLSSLLL